MAFEINPSMNFYGSLSLAAMVRVSANHLFIWLDNAGHPAESR